MIKYNLFFLKSALNNKLKIKFKLCHFISLFNNILEILSIAIIIPVLTFFLRIDNDFFLSNNIDFFYKLKEIHQVLMIFLFVFTFFLIRAVAQIFILSYQRKFIAQLTKNIQGKIFERCIFIDLKDLSKSPLSNQLRNLSDVGRLSKFTENLLLLNTNIVLTIFIVCFLFLYNAKITIFFILMFAILGFIYQILTDKFFLSTGIELRNRTSAILNSVYNALNSMKEIIIDKKREYFFKLFSTNNERSIYIDYKTAVYGIAPRVIGEFFLATIMMIVFIYFFLEKYDNSEIILNLTIFAFAGLRLLPSFTKIINSSQTLKQNFFSTKKIFEIINKPFKAEIENFSKKQLNISDGIQ